MLNELFTRLSQKNILSFFVCLVFILVCFTRLYQLDNKPYHHDESLYAKYSYDYAHQNYYQFNPILHGPMLFTVQSLLFKIFGDSDTSGRLTSALSGIALAYLICALLYFIFHQFYGVMTALVMLCLSPVLVYFSRFLGMDMLLAMLNLLLLYCLSVFIVKKQKRYLYTSVLAASLMICTKLNYLFYFFTFFTYALVIFAFQQDLFQRKKNALKHYFYSLPKWHWGLLLLIPIIVFSALYSGFGQDWSGILDGLYRKMIPYWINQHKIQRIKGPFDYYLPLMLQYELPILLGLGIYFFKTVFSSLQQKKFFLISTGAVFALYFLGILPFWDGFFANLFKPLHLSEPHHFLVLAFFIYAGISMTLYHLKKNELFLSFCIFWFWVTFSLYSYAGEKVPWLLVHILVPAILYLAPLIGSYIHRSLEHTLKKRVLGLLLIVLMTWQTLNVLRTNFIFQASPNNLLAYTHTSWETLDMANKIIQCEKALPDLKVQTLQNASSVWPLTWYLRDYQGWFTIQKDPSEDADIFIQDWHLKDQVSHPRISQYSSYRYKLREWFVPYKTKHSLSAYLKYILFWTPQDDAGSLDSIVYVHPRALDCWINAPTS